MTNPYGVPQAELEGESLSMRKKTGWKIFFWLYLIVEILGVIGLFFSADESVFDVVGEVVVYSFVLVGLFAFAYNKKIAIPLVWKLVMLVLFGWDCYIFSSVYTEDVFGGLDAYVAIGISVPIAIVLFLQYFALYQYAFQSKEIWNKA